MLAAPGLSSGFGSGGRRLLGSSFKQQKLIHKEHLFSFCYTVGGGYGSKTLPNNIGIRTKKNSRILFIYLFFKI